MWCFSAVGPQQPPLFSDPVSLMLWAFGVSLSLSVKVDSSSLLDREWDCLFSHSYRLRLCSQFSAYPYLSNNLKTQSLFFFFLILEPILSILQLPYTKNLRKILTRPLFFILKLAFVSNSKLKKSITDIVSLPYCSWPDLTSPWSSLT